MPSPHPPTRKYNFTQQFLNVLIIFKLQLSEIPQTIYYTILTVFLILAYRKQGNNVGSILMYICILIIIFGDLLECEIITLISVIIAIFNYMFVVPKMYTLPQYEEYVGLRENYSKKNNKEFYWAEWYPVDSEANAEQIYQIPWANTIQINKIVSYLNLSNRMVLSMIKFFISSLSKYKLIFSKSKAKPTNDTILFSHGRTGTPFLYSSILMKLAIKSKIISPQHSQVNVTPYTDEREVKIYRENQVKQRADEIIHLANKIPQTDNIALMGHSYGCATIIQAYHTIPLSIRKRITKIVLLDPWLFPLTEQIFNTEITCPILMLVNQHFIQFRDMYERNKRFLERHGSKIVYICWKNGDHLHQTDMPFLVGNSLGIVKDAGECVQQLENNLEAIQMFLIWNKLSGKEIEQINGKFNNFDLGRSYKPMKFKQKFSL